MSRIAGSPLIPAAQAGQIKASADLLSTLYRMQAAHAAARDVAGVVAKFDSAAFFAALDNGVERLDTVYDANSDRRIRAALTRLEAEHARGGWAARTDPVLLYAARRDMVASLAVTADDRLTPGRRTAALRAAVGEQRKADASLRDALSCNPSPAVRKRIAEANRTQALDLLAKIAAIFPAV